MPYLLSIILGALLAVFLAWHWPQASEVSFLMCLINAIILAYLFLSALTYCAVKYYSAGHPPLLLTYFKPFIYKFLIACLIFSYTYLFFYHAADRQRESWQLLSHAKHDVEVEFQISSLVKYEENRRSFYARVLSVTASDYLFLQGTNIKVSDYSDEQAMHFLPCDRVKAVVRLKPIRGLANQYSFDFERYAFSQQWQGSAYIRQSLQHRQPNFIQRLVCVDRFRQSFKQWLLSKVPKQNSAWLLALTIGDKTEFNTQQRQFLSTSSLAHLFVISGLHVGIVSAWVYFLSLALAKSLFRPEMINPLVCAAWLTLLGVSFYVLLVGASLSSLRALIMLVAVLWGRLSGFTWSLPIRLALAFCITFFIWPLSLLGMGFWLSYSAVFIIYLYSLLLAKPLIRSLSAKTTVDIENNDSVSIKQLALQKWLHYLKHYLGLQVFIFFMLQPFVYGFNLQVNLLAPILNIIAIPIISLIFVPLALILMSLFPLYGLFEVMGVAYIFDGFAAVLSQLLVVGVDTVQWLIGHALFVDLTAMQIQLPYKQSLIFLVLIAALCLMSLYAYRLALRAIVFVNLMVFSSLLIIQFLSSEKVRESLILSPPATNLSQVSNIMPRTKPKLSPLIMHLFDVGQGLSIAFHSKNKTWIYDTGSSWSQGSMAASVIEPHLKNIQVTVIDHLILSHLDNDHAGGFGFLLEHFVIKRLSSSALNELSDKISQIQVAKQTIKGNKIQQENINRLSAGDSCYAGQHWQLGEYFIEVFHPQYKNENVDTLLTPTSSSKRTSKQRNNASCVVLVSNQTQAILLTGDISSAIEKRLLNNKHFLESLKGKQLTLVLAHHGSKYSNSSAWLKKLKPKLAIASAAYLSRFNHPHPDVKARLITLEIPFLTTASSGQISMTFNTAVPPLIRLQRLNTQDRVWNVAYSP